MSVSCKHNEEMFGTAIVFALSEANVAFQKRQSFYDFTNEELFWTAIVSYMGKVIAQSEGTGSES